MGSIPIINILPSLNYGYAHKPQLSMSLTLIIINFVDSKCISARADEVVYDLHMIVTYYTKRYWRIFCSFSKAVNYSRLHIIQ